MTFFFLSHANIFSAKWIFLFLEAVTDTRYIFLCTNIFSQISLFLGYVLKKKILLTCESSLYIKQPLDFNKMQLSYNSGDKSTWKREFFETYLLYIRLLKGQSNKDKLVYNYFHVVYSCNSERKIQELILTMENWHRLGKEIYTKFMHRYKKNKNKKLILLF